MLVQLPLTDARPRTQGAFLNLTEQMALVDRWHRAAARGQTDALVLPVRIGQLLAGWRGAAGFDIQMKAQ